MLGFVSGGLPLICICNCSFQYGVVYSDVLLLPEIYITSGDKQLLLVNSSYNSQIVLLCKFALICTPVSPSTQLSMFNALLLITKQLQNYFWTGSGKNDVFSAKLHIVFIFHSTTFSRLNEYLLTTTTYSFHFSLYLFSKVTPIPSSLYESKQTGSIQTF